jgi:hypothetical protein
VSEALGACHELDALYRNLARELRRVLNFDVLGVATYDESSHTFVPSVSNPRASRCRRPSCRPANR